MDTKTIYWVGDSGDKLTVSYSGTSGQSTCSVSSDPNSTCKDRSKTLQFSTIGNNAISIYVTVTQTSDNMTIITINDTNVTQDNIAIGYVNTI